MWLPVLLAACARRPPVTPIPDDPDPRLEVLPSSAGVHSPALRSVLDAHWEATMARNPEWATTLGDHRFDDRLSDPTEAAERRWYEQLGRLELELLMIPDDLLSRGDQLTRELLLEELRGEQALRSCRFAEWNLSARSNELVALHDLAEQATLAAPSDGANLLARYRAFPAMVDGRVERLRQGLAAGRVSNRVTVERVVAMLDEALARPPETWAPYTTLVEAPATVVADEQRAAFEAAVAEVFATGIVPALTRYRDLLRDEVLPKATEGDRIGVAALPGGEDCYRASVRVHTTLQLDPEKVHQTGLDELARIHAELRELGARALGTDDLGTLVRRLRDDPELRFRTSDEVRDTAEAALRRAEAAVPRWFGEVPAAPCEVDVVPDYLAPYTTIAWYEPVRPDGSRPGTYFVNTWQPETRPRFEAEVLAFHESVPGHHLQIAASRELGELPSFRRLGGHTVFVEGWALYVVLLADEMGLYTSDLDRLGMLSFDAWRASRLVVDTGVHAMGWSRERAEAFMLENTALTPQNVANEVDRYVSWPGQALGYKIGQIRLRELRRDAEARLGERFDPKAFHDVVLGEGAVPLEVLDRQVEAWITDQEEGSGPLGGPAR